MDSETKNAIDEGIQKMTLEKEPRPTPETHRIMPSITIKRGQNSPEIFQTN
jgi:hypothetical protein